MNLFIAYLQFVFFGFSFGAVGVHVFYPTPLSWYDAVAITFSISYAAYSAALKITNNSVIKEDKLRGKFKLKLTIAILIGVLIRIGFYSLIP